ncbi:hypothetical protein HGRIS_013741 [Hohenbuehelia grisea]|uniref:Uncharacterized protein n=1 Tax=Hohenbuehelia grisea TaxID=104357 RepID=A0ABR3IWJ1_9AGAR
MHPATTTRTTSTSEAASLVQESTPSPSKIVATGMIQGLVQSGTHDNHPANLTESIVPVVETIDLEKPPKSRESYRSSRSPVPASAPQETADLHIPASGKYVRTEPESQTIPKYTCAHHNNGRNLVVCTDGLPHQLSTKVCPQRFAKTLNIN